MFDDILLSRTDIWFFLVRGDLSYVGVVMMGLKIAVGK